MNVAFPLHDGYFPPLQATAEDRARWTRLVRDLVQQTLEEERPYFASGYEDIDTRQWKLVRRKDQLRVFRPRHEPSSRSTGSSAPCLLEIGTIEGTLEDVIYGVHNSTTHDMRVTTSFLSADALDSAVLHVFENGADDDLFRSFTLKWRILETPAGNFVKNRDVLLLEYMGIARDSNGDRFAFHVCDSIEHPVCPPFDPKRVVRAETHARILYRQVRPGRVGVYFRAENTSGGRIPTMLARWTVVEVAVSIGLSVECAEAKKLTTIALAAHASDHHKRAAQHGSHGESSAQSCSICDEAAHKALRACDVCRSHVCTRCRSRKYLLSDEGKVQIVCCKQCIVAAKTMTVDPRKPLGIISASYWHKYDAIVSANGQTPESRSYRAVFQSTTSASPQESNTRVRKGTADDDSRDSSQKRADERRKTREDVYELVAAMSTTTESTAESVSSREGTLGSMSGSFEASPSTDTHLQVHQANDPEALWRQMQQLHVAAEETYRIAKKNSENWVQ